MFKLASRSKTAGTFDPAVLQQGRIDLVTPMPTLPPEVTIEIKMSDDFDRSLFNDKFFVCAVLSVVIIATLLGLYSGGSF